MDVLCVRGNGGQRRHIWWTRGRTRRISSLAATASDETNMLCCLVAKKLERIIVAGGETSGA